MSEAVAREIVVEEGDLTRDAGVLARTWDGGRGVIAWFSEVDHKRIGIRFIVTAMAFFALGGLLALTMRLQLAVPENHLVGPDLYNQIFTMHGTTMMFLFAVPVMEGFGIYLVPLMVGARAVSLPRLVAFGYWIFLFGGLFLFTMFALNTGPDNGWFSYVPLAGPEYAPGKRADVWAQLITFTEVASMVGAVALIVTVFKCRAPGMSIDRLPLFVWAQLVTSFMILFAMPAVMLASTALILDRLVSTHFFNQAEGGDPILFQHLFWFFGHPEVYLIFMPALGMMSTLIQTFSGRAIIGYPIMVVSLVATAFLGFGLWVHHMFATGLPQVGESFFTAASIMIAIPSGAQIFCWIATIWCGRVRWQTPMLYALGFFVIFVIGGMTGLMVASVPLDLQVHDTFFVVAHLHYVLIGGAVFPLFGAIHYWFPKMTGRMLSDALGKAEFALFFVGFNLTFFPMHLLGLHGMPRRVYTYLPGLGWDGMNLAATIGALTIGVAVALLIVNAARALAHAPSAEPDPWHASTLEWSVTSPPPRYNYHPVPVVTARDPLWEPSPSPVVVGIRSDKRQVLITSVVEASPDHLTVAPGPSIWPFLTAVATTILFIGSIFTPWAVVWGAIPVTITLIGWFWPKQEDIKANEDERAPELPQQGARTRTPEAPGAPA